MGHLAFVLFMSPDYSQHGPPVLKMYVYGQKEEPRKKVWIDCCKSIVTLGHQPLYELLVVYEETHFYLKKTASIIFKTGMACAFCEELVKQSLNFMSLENT